ncbi:MAG: 2OG-Fe(II) oxygenase, partial [Proteobacteria bacterium]|nr:2OG-Fe(II) oxygenase [Pseudomonadota bacterium]
MDASNDVVVRTRSLEGQDLHIVDGLFKPDFVAMLHEIAKRFAFSLYDADTRETSHVRHWRCDLVPEEMGKHPVLGLWLKQVELTAAKLFPGVKGTLREAYCNNHGYGDHQHPHIDAPSGITVLYYVNAEWQPDWQGETLLFEGSQDAHHAVAPRPGRLLMFPASILHRGGTPSRTCFERRLVLVAKFRA